ELGSGAPGDDHGSHLVTITRANARSPIHRPDHLALVSVHRRDAAGNLVGEHRFIGLYTALTYRGSAMDIPYLHHKVTAVLQRAGYPLDSHSGRELWNILETYPRDELFEIEVDDLFRIATAVLHLQDRKQVRLLARRDRWNRYVSCLVFVPRDRYSTSIVEQLEEVLLDAFGGTAAEHETLISESVLARVHFLVQLRPDSPRVVDLDDVERQLALVTRWWVDGLRDAMVEAFDEEDGLALFARYGHAFPAAYREQYGPRIAVHDVRRIEALAVSGGIVTALHRAVEAPDGDIRLKLYTAHALTLSEVLPLLEDMGVSVTDERPFAIHLGDGVHVWLYDIGLRGAPGSRIDDRAVQDEFRATFAALLRGDVETDGFNRLVLGGGLTSRQVTLLRAYAKYLRQTGTAFSQRYIEEVLARHPAIVAQLVALFAARFDPALDGHRALEAAGISAEVAQALDDVASLDEDRILRSFLSLIEATTRTSYYRAGPDGGLSPVIAFKLDPERVPDLPLPRPMYEIWVYSPRVEGVHLRGGPVARGGLRWSDRREDFRTEVLGLMKAQMVKNAVIVPVGAKGGFVVKRPPADAEALRAEVVACYRAFVSALLDITDNIVNGRVVVPECVVRHDGDDPYLVVAADKGTASFSDIANEISTAHGFWLGDAFASGGSAGYDHKAMGITAKGAWESVRRHFRILGVDADAAPITCVGIGDMSGDVFGNGMLLSRQLRLLAAFDHRHIFLDPDPDPERAWAERRRLFEMPRSSWAD
ncbi:MAG TPA: NAD-glutamate dehydrogenase domain-containing protein, partial [Acidimicrobiales bacterium]